MLRLGPRLSVGILVFIVSLASSTWEFPSSSDGTAMFTTAVNLLERHTLAIDARFTADDEYSPSAKRGADGRAYAKYGLGLPVVELPFLGLARGASGILGLSEPHVQAVVLSLLNPLLTALAAILIQAMCERLGASRAAARLAALGYAFGTLAWAYAITDGTEALQACLIALSAWALVIFERDRRDRALWICGAALAGGVLTKTIIAVLAPPFVIGAWLACRSHGATWPAAIARSMKLAAPVAFGIAAVAWLNWMHFGSVTESGYDRPLFTHPLGSGLYGLVFSPTKGLIFYAPSVLLVPLGAVTLFRRSTALAVAGTLGAIVWTVLNAMFPDWGGGWCWGPRYLLPILPFAFAAVGLAADRSQVGGIARALFAVGFTVNLLGVVVSEDAYRRTTMGVWLVDRTGYVMAGSTLEPGRLVKIPRSAEDVLPPFSSIAGHWWLARVALAGCDCTTASAACECRTGQFAANRVFLSPPWSAQFSDAIPLAPYGVSIIQPMLLRGLYRAVILDPDREPRSTSRLY